jgi:hypothetical protein
MQFTESATMGDLLAEITRLEIRYPNFLRNWIPIETIGLLKQTLAERESQFSNWNQIWFLHKLLLQNALNKICLQNSAKRLS